ncbi:MAG: hypothetical protein ABFD46_02775 [Armatimonadota bacterium]
MTDTSLEAGTDEEKKEMGNIVDEAAILFARLFLQQVLEMRSRKKSENTSDSSRYLR